MRTYISLLLFFALLSPGVSFSQANPARTHLQAAIDAMGGEDRLRTVESLRLDGMGHYYALEQSEHPEGPWITVYEQISELRDVKRQQVRRHTWTRSQWIPQARTTTVIYDGEAAAAAQGDQQRAYPSYFTNQFIRDLAIAPERVLLHALAASNLHTLPDDRLHGVPHHIVAFTFNEDEMRIWLNAYTHLPSAVEFVQPSYMDVWGNVVYRTEFSLWDMEPGGLRYPKQWDTFHNDLPYRSFSLFHLTLNPEAPADSFAINEPVKAQYAQLAQMPGYRDIPLGYHPRGPVDRPVQEIAPGLIEIPGSWDVALVRQEDGIVVLEAPISPEYSALVLEEAKRRYPNTSVKAVVTTSDAWPHVGGVREYVAEQVPVYVHTLNIPLLQKMINADFGDRPDQLARQPQSPFFRSVESKTVIGKGDNLIELYPIWGEGGERMIHEMSFRGLAESASLTALGSSPV